MKHRLFPFRLDGQGNARCRICDSQVSVSYDKIHKRVIRQCRNWPHSGFNWQQVSVGYNNPSGTQWLAWKVSKQLWNMQQGEMK